ncbi:hypothetical protein [Lederbergia lenta]|uniref:Protein of uncharacterized function (DUF2628) n=1 Tax=Lederbergia lenta TaxID=1467 RepID=A0A2X4WHB6_LEDLE|nr:hypothetical protein [Lederbergia lenta]MCM3111874.1 DUF2628 domain-containing protein [Lederbergia lenta]MEC2323028.1 DUF2628 domain-containing protein [Lederbergia lenta]SQI62229.1 Protein of uncharacterised function (DUF2628) [Lederbergia lenta]
MRVKLRNDAGVVKDVKIGFSWTTFFFGFFPALFRGDLKWAAIMFVSSVAIGLITFGFGGWIPGIIFSFIYNNIYIKDLLEKGYRPADEQAEAELKSRGIISGNQAVS